MPILPTPVPTPAPASDNGSAALSTGQVIGIVAGSLAGVGIAAAAFMYFSGGSSIFSAAGVTQASSMSNPLTKEAVRSYGGAGSGSYSAPKDPWQ